MLTSTTVNQPLATFPPAYPYLEFNDDIYVGAFFTALNEYQQAYVARFNTIDMPIYTKIPADSTGWLDWILTGIYGIPRPVFGQITGTTQIGGPYDTWAYDTQLYNANGFSSTYSFTAATDDQYQRVATWNLYLGDSLQPDGSWGRQFNVRWLKRRVLRFLTGTGGTDPGIDQTYLISVTCTANGFLIACDSSLGSGNITALTEALNGGFLGVPFIYAYTVTTA